MLMYMFQLLKRKEKLAGEGKFEVPGEVWLVRKYLVMEFVLVEGRQEFTDTNSIWFLPCLILSIYKYL